MNRKWDAVNREQELKQIQSREYDLIIIGGGITGAGIARECALRNLSFCLLEKNDFAFGTSSRSSKLFHGGMRYLSNLEFGLVRESTTERNWLRNHLPNLVRPLGFMYCAYQRGKDTPFKVRLAVRLYQYISDCFSEHKNYRKSRIFKRDFVEEFEPAVPMELPGMGKLVCAGFFYDTTCDDARVTLEIIKESLVYSEGRSAAINYAKVEGFIKNSAGKVTGVSVRDVFSGQKFEIRGKVVVSATGIWTDEVMAETSYGEPKIYPTKGVHVIVPQERIGNRNAFGVRSIDDGRFFFVLRRGPVSVIGTTDTAYYPESKNLDEPWCKKEDCDYLLRSVNFLFPEAQLTYKDIIGTYAGIRPLIRQEGVESESQVSRSHEIFDTKEGVVAIAGGKSTTHRRMAEDLLFYLVKQNYLPPFAKKEYGRRGYSKIPFLVGISWNDFKKLVAEKNLLEVCPMEQLKYLHQQYGRGALLILEDIKSHPSRGLPLLENYPHCEAEIRYILNYENAPKLLDILCRRTEAQWMIWHYLQRELAEKVAAIAAEHYGWSEEVKAAEIEEYCRYVKNTVAFLES